MSPSSRPGRRVPSKGRGLRFGSAPEPVAGAPSGTTGSDATGASTERVGTRAANRAAKRAASGVRPGTALRGRSGGRSGGNSNTGLIALAVVAIVVVGAVIAIGNPFGSPAASPSAGPTAGPTTSAVVGDGTCPTTQPAPLAAGQTRTVTIKTSKGDIVIRIDGSLSPIAAGNFVALVACHFYDGSVFHRTPTLQDGTPFVIQGGSPKPGTGEIAYAITDEPVTATYRRGTLAMARTSQPNSQTSQFFIVLDDKSASPLASANTYAIFGEVIAGMDVADAIYAASAGQELPSSPIAMTSVIVGPGPAATTAPTTAPTLAPTAAPTVLTTSPATSPAASTAPTSTP